MRRPPAYSDSFLIISPKLTLNEDPLLEQVQEPPLEADPKESWTQWSLLFIFKGSFHILCISVFETTFYFLYVNKSEDAGIVGTINTYYQPLIKGCAQWPNGTKWLVREVLTYSVNQTLLDAQGAAAASQRSTFNTSLIIQSSLYSVGTLVLCVGIVGISLCRKWKVAWGTIFLENMLFIGVLAAYEFFFYNTIIYRYMTLSTAELNRYLVDGLASCAM
jgi:hypothetical protein